MKTKAFLLALLLFPLFLGAQISTKIPDVDKYARTDFVKSTMGVVQVLDSTISYKYNGSSWDSTQKKCIHSRHWGTQGLPNEWCYWKYNKTENRWDHSFYDRYTYFSDTAEIVDEFIKKPYNQFTMNWETDTMIYVKYLGYPSSQFGQMFEKNIIMNYDAATCSFTNGMKLEMKIKDDTLYDYGYGKIYNPATCLWEIQGRILISYDANNYIQKELEQIWSQPDNAFLNSEQYIFVYENGLKMQTVSQYWVSGEWKNSEKTVFEYSPSGRKTLERIIKWDDINSKWVNYKQNIYIFSGGLETERLVQNWNVSTETWDNSIRWSSTYDENSNLLTLRKDVWNGSLWVYSNKYTYTYNSNNQETSGLYQIWASSAWKNENKEIYTYDGNYNKILYVYQKWDNGESAWKNDKQTEYSYDTYNNMTIEVKSLWNSITTSWDYDAKNEYYYSGFDATSLSELTNGTITAFPNPTNGFITVSPKDKQYERITITDLTGRVVMDCPIYETGMYINLKQYGSGMYIINLTDHSGKTNSTKVIVL